MPAEPSPAKLLAGFIAKFDPVVAALIRRTRAAVRRRLPTAHELVYDNYNFFVIGFSSTLRPSDCIVSVVASAKGVALAFYYGADLPDPDGILLGDGTQNRFVRMDGGVSPGAPAVARLIRAATAQGKTPLPRKGPGELVIRSISAKQRPRRTVRRAAARPGAVKK
jgi:hypothetical protein